MNTEQLSDKNISRLEQQIATLLKTMRIAKLSELPIYVQLQELEQTLGEARRARFDTSHTDYPGY